MWEGPFFTLPCRSPHLSPINVALPRPSTLSFSFSLSALLLSDLHQSPSPASVCSSMLPWTPFWSALGKSSWCSYQSQMARLRCRPCLGDLGDRTYLLQTSSGSWVSFIFYLFICFWKLFELPWVWCVVQKNLLAKSNSRPRTRNTHLDLDPVFTVMLLSVEMLSCQQ